MEHTGSSGPFAAREVPTAVTLGLASALFASVFVLRMNVDNPAEGLSLLYTLPIALVALRMGWRAGLAAALVALTLFTLYASLEHVEVSPLGYATRAAAFALLGGLLGAFVERSRAAEKALADHALRLADLMRRIDPLRPGRRASSAESPAVNHESEVVALSAAFNEMLDRIERERRESAWRELSAQEGDRRRLARELHDEVGQVLTGLVLRLDRVARQASPDLAHELGAAQEIARGSLEDVRRIMHELRPEVLDDLGLVSALDALAREFGKHTGIPVTTRLDEDLPALTSEAELVVYRIAQEGLTNAARHADATEIELRLSRSGRDGLQLKVNDDGRGLDGAATGSGIRGMRERALAIGSDLTLEPRPDGGTSLLLTVDAEAVAEATAT